ncbi:MAG: 7-carboxy-7-deazaguanine synthase QueE [Methylococcaceae bacterium]
MGSLRITEIFLSIQGESTTIGIPTVFIRLTGCPLRCLYCDTAYAFTGGQKMEIDAIVDQASHYGVRHITVTGGEPLSQPACLELIEKLLDLNFIVSLETSGAIDIATVDVRAIKVMDLKTPSSGEISKNRYENIPHLTPQDQVKFVIGNLEDYQWAKDTLTQYALPERCEVLFSPVMGQQNPTQLAEKILEDKLPVRFQIQLHKFLWGDAQGR